MSRKKVILREGGGGKQPRIASKSESYRKTEQKQLSSKPSSDREGIVKMKRGEGPRPLRGWDIKKGGSQGPGEGKERNF